MPRPTSVSSSTTTTTDQGITRSLSLKTTTKSQHINTLLVSDVKLFLTNLRLLDLDLYSDWPDIATQTFSVKNADQKQRISGTEWALFRLFEIWNPVETAQKLQPFFPPLEPLQSLNLRAALFRWLDELKKDGMLGRETVLRKTMLDECKGDKFYEIIALFSNIVLKKAVAAKDSDHQSVTIARQLATASRLSVEKQRSLLPLAIAHKAALVNVLRRKEAKRKQFLEFEALLDSKAQEIHQRLGKIREASHDKDSSVPRKEMQAVKKQLQDNWVGEQKWLDIMLYGNGAQGTDVFLSGRFDKLWRAMESGQQLEYTAHEPGLVEKIQLRLDEQKRRLEKWNSFRDEMQSIAFNSNESELEKPPTVQEIRFDDHLNYQLPTSKMLLDQSSVQRPTIGVDYQQIIDELDVDLAYVFKNAPSQPFGVANRRRRSSGSATRSPPRSTKMSRSESFTKATGSPLGISRPRPPSRNPSFEQISRPRKFIAMGTPLDLEATLIGHLSTVRNVVPSQSYEALVKTPEKRRPEPESTPPASDPISETPTPTPSTYERLYTTKRAQSPPSSSDPPSPYPSEPPILRPDHPDLDSEEALAEQIISSIGDATPSPVKKPQPRMSLSLIDRTRLSMARITSFEPVPVSPDLPLPPMPPPPAIQDPLRPRATLLERTRLSMVATQSKPRLSLALREKEEKRNSSRNSLFPVNQFDTLRIRQSPERIEESHSTQRTPKEDIFSDEADYDKIFKSRPRIATSPVFSPQGGEVRGDEGGYDEESADEGDVTGIDLGDVDQDCDEDGFTTTWVNSPSRRKGPVGT